ncbi:hypothetical protein F5J12DRAFT_865837 [Pisolithus orientalis]|uniref:uncharacterized protein n=1 Tax=Pisolithus orientalis TaxID=936130 RepID=UPI0022254A9C|nr:uncharacterized protein F5J12DRAFT_865837 [Pisolithus orientalis]KAI5988226.1 hypothetical protein F5J12DRAFT_865837 [Pisolithus orientalis]
MSRLELGAIQWCLGFCRHFFVTLALISSSHIHCPHHATTWPHPGSDDLHFIKSDSLLGHDPMADLTCVCLLLVLSTRFHGHEQRKS